MAASPFQLFLVCYENAKKLHLTIGHQEYFVNDLNSKFMEQGKINTIIYSVLVRHQSGYSWE
jgi:hypothetical protein